MKKIIVEIEIYRKPLIFVFVSASEPQKRVSSACRGTRYGFRSYRQALRSCLCFAEPCIAVSAQKLDFLYDIEIINSGK